MGEFTREKYQSFRLSGFRVVGVRVCDAAVCYKGGNCEGTLDKK